MKTLFLFLSFFGLISSSTHGWCATDKDPDKMTLPLFDARDMTPYWINESSSHSEGNSHIPASVTGFTAINQNNVSITEKAFDGRISVVNFFFAQCGSTCPLMMKSIQKFQKNLKKRGLSSQVEFYSFSVTPEDDSPSDLKAYAEMHGFDLSNWTFLTGKRSEIYHVGKDMFKADRSVGNQKSGSSFLHSEDIYLVDSKRRIRGIYMSSSKKQMDYLGRDILELKRE